MTDQETPLIDPEALGIEVSWSFGHGQSDAVELPRADVRDCFFAAGLDANHYVEAIDEDDALRRAARYAKQSKRIVVRPLARPRKDTPRAYGIYARDERDGEAGDGWKCGARVRMSGLNAVCLPPEGSATSDPDCKQVGDEMAARANVVLDNCQNVDISNALCALGYASIWVNRRRNSGGVYLIRSDSDESRERAEKFVKVLKGIAKLSGRHAIGGRSARAYQFFPQIQEVYPKPLTMASWGESAREDIEADVRGLIVELGQMSIDGKMRDKTKTARAEEADALIRKAEHLRVFLGSAVEDIAGLLTGIRDGFLKAIGESTAAAKTGIDAVMDSVEQAACTNCGRRPDVSGVAGCPACEVGPPDPAPQPAVAPARRGRRRLSEEDLSLFDVGV